MLHEYQTAEVFVTGNEKTAFLTRAGQQIAVGSASQVEFSGSNAIADQLQYHLHGHARACHARFAKVDRGADLYSTHGLTLHPSMLARQAGLCRLLSCAARRRIHEFRGQAFSANSPLGANAKIDFETTTRFDLPVHPGECSSASSAPVFRAKAKR